MDFFDPQKQKRHAIRLAVGYAVIGTVLLLATTILLHWAYGYGLDKEGRVIQNGLVFVSSRPEGADAYLNGKKYKDQTNTRVTLPAGQYLLELKREGYHDWKRVVTVEGGSVERFDYSLLFPARLDTSVVKQYTGAPALSTESLDRRWLLVSAPEQNKFDLFDLDADQPSSQSLTLPADILASSSTTTGWKLVEWAKDNRHVLLLRSYDRLGQAASEYVLFDRERPDLSRNLSVAMGFTPTDIELRDQAHDQYYVFDQNSGQVFTANLDQPTPQPLAGGVLAFSSEKDVVAYATA
ncbi:MAG TPA: PEGA domain-containing protein, partial [Nitrososphaera sp.]|nr:PEGA domain-containing protein [Nitrososphaera sp.]